MKDPVPFLILVGMLFTVVVGGHYYIKEQIGGYLNVLKILAVLLVVIVIAFGWGWFYAHSPAGAPPFVLYH